MEEGRKGYVPVLVGKGGHNMEKIWVSIKAIQHPTIVELLDQSADELGYQQGLLRIIYDVDNFKAIVDKASKNCIQQITCMMSCISFSVNQDPFSVNQLLLGRCAFFFLFNYSGKLNTSCYFFLIFSLLFFLANNISPEI